MFLKRIWILLGESNADDYEFLVRSATEYQIIPASPTEVQYNSSVSYWADEVPPKIYIATYDDKEETWLKIYFGDRLLLIEEKIDYKYENSVRL